MPNWCYTSYVIDGKRKEVQSLFSKMNNLENRKKPLVDNTFGKTWLGCLVNKLGGNWQEVYCRGSWSDLDWNGAILRFNTETAWGPMNEVFKFIKTIYPSLEIYWQAEEDGNGVYCSNDVEGRYFRDRYRIEYDCDYEYFTTIDGLAEYVSGIIGKEVKTMDDINAAIETWNNATDDYDEMIYLNEYTVEADELLCIQDYCERLYIQVVHTVEQPKLCLRKGTPVVADCREDQFIKISKTKNEMIVKFITCLIVFLMIGGIFLLGRIEFDPEEENEAIVNEKKKAA